MLRWLWRLWGSEGFFSERPESTVARCGGLRDVEDDGRWVDGGYYY